jgi:peptidoglycan/LPS O-acetylase OafA/YrhL
MDAIAMGCLTALIASRYHLSRAVLWTLGSVGAALLIFNLGFSIRAYAWGLGRNGLDMTMLGIGTCMLIIAAAQTQWQSPRFLAPLLILGQRSYEVYLTHLFVVLGLFRLFVDANKPMRAVPLLFALCILFAGVLGMLVARGYSELLNRWLRNRWGDGPRRLGSVVELQASR